MTPLNPLCEDFKELYRLDLKNQTSITGQSSLESEMRAGCRLSYTGSP